MIKRKKGGEVEAQRKISNAKFGEGFWCLFVPLSFVLFYNLNLIGSVY
jgi:hypothetical protein